MTGTPTPETPAELAAKAKRIAMEARDWFARFEFEEARYREGNGHRTLRLEALNHTHEAIDRLESLATLAASSTGPEPAGEVFTKPALVPGGMVQYRARLYREYPAGTLLYAAPAAAERKPFTLQTIHALISQTFADDSEPTDAELTLIRAVERAHGIKAPAGSEGE